MSYSNSELQDLVEGGWIVINKGEILREGGGGGGPPSPDGKKMEIRKRLDDFWRGGEGVQSQILKYLWVATFPCGGFGGPPPKKI